jgi:hypothetical protein
MVRRRLATEQKDLGPHATNLQRAKLLERANSLRRRIEAWRAVQVLYIPGVQVLLAHLAQSAAASSREEQVPEMRLFLPSALRRRVPCHDKLMHYEWRLRFAQAEDALDDLRHGLRLRTHLYHKKDREARGVAENTRAAANIRRQQAKVNAAAQKYRVARKALEALAISTFSAGWDTKLPKLEDADIRGMGQAEDGVSEGRRKVSWIWTNYTAVSQAGQDPSLNDCEGFTCLHLALGS